MNVPMTGGDLRSSIANLKIRCHLCLVSKISYVRSMRRCVCSVVKSLINLARLLSLVAYWVVWICRQNYCLNRGNVLCCNRTLNLLCRILMLRYLSNFCCLVVRMRP